MSNPYEAPSGDMPSWSRASELPPPQEPGLVGQVRIVSILMIVQGTLVILVGLAVAGFAIFMSTMLRNGTNLGGPPGGVSPSFAANMTLGMYGGMGIVIVTSGALSAYAGYRNWKFKGRTLGIIALVTGLGAVFTCYCAPTGLALCVYGLIVYLNGPVAAAFLMGEEGYSGDEIALTFSPVRYAQSLPKQ